MIEITENIAERSEATEAKPKCKNGCENRRILKSGRCVLCGIYYLQRKQRDFIKFTTQIDTSGSCWYWKGVKMDSGYGLFINRAGITEMAHRASYKHYRGPIRPGMVLDHLCRNPWCVNPHHLEEVTAKENRSRVGKPSPLLKFALT